MVRKVARREFWLAIRRQQEKFWTREIWDATRFRPDRPSPREIGYLVARILYIVVDAFRTERIRLRAAALTYTTLLSLVPALAVVFSLFTAFGGLRDVQARLQAFVVDALAVGERDLVLEYLDRFVGQVHAGSLGTIGVVVLFFTVVSTLANIETAFNDIWGVTKGRSWVERFQVYWPLVTIAPVLLGVSLSLTASFQASEAVQGIVDTVPALRLLAHLVPVLLTGMSLTLLYHFMPNTRVPISSALVGGMVAGTLWVIAQQLYAVYAANAISYSAIYGSLGAVPLFIIWLYVSWTVALLGATLTFAVQSAGTYEPDREISQREKEYAAARLMLAVASHFERGEGVISVEQLLDEARISARLARQVLESLVQAELLAETATADGRDAAYVPGRPLDATTFADVVNVLQAAGTEPLHAGRPGDPSGVVAKAALLSGERARSETLAKESLLELIRRVRAATEAPSSKVFPESEKEAPIPSESSKEGDAATA